MRQRAMIARALVCGPVAADRRRADDRARRDHPGADPRACCARCSRSSAWRSCSSPTTSASSRRWPTASPSCMPAASSRRGAGARHLPPPGASLHPRAARRGAAARRHRARPPHPADRRRHALIFEPPAGCRFHPRCPVAELPRCAAALPPVHRARGQHAVACIHGDRRGRWRDRAAARGASTSRSATRSASGGLWAKHDRLGQRRRRRLAHDRARRDAWGSSARVGLGQDLARARGAARRRAVRRARSRSAIGGTRHRGHRARQARAAPGAAAHADDLPGPLCLAEPADDGARHPERAADRRRRRAGSTADRRSVDAKVLEIAAACGLSREQLGAAAARLLRRPAAADRHRPRAGAQPGARGLRRADLVARRVDPGADPEPARRAAGSARPDLPLHRPRPRRRRLCLRPGGGDVSRPDRRDRHDPGRSTSRRGIPTPRR